MKKPDHEFEALRLKALNSYRILDTNPEKCFDGLTDLAATICHAKIAAISLSDESRQWFKSIKGLNASEVPRANAFCNYAINEDQILVIEDTLEDDFFRTNPNVTEAPHIRFYAGAVLKNRNGFNLGTLCVMDTDPKVLTANQKKSLILLADQVVAQLELHLKDLLLDEERIKSKHILEVINASPDFIGTCDLKGDITFHNESFNRVSKIDLENNIYSYYPEWAKEKVNTEAIPYAMKHGSWKGEVSIFAKNGDEIAVEQTVVCHKNAKGEPEFFSTIMHDLSKLHKSISQLGTLVANIPAAVAMFDKDIKYIAASKNWISDYGLDKLGHTRDSIIGKSHYDIFPVILEEWREHHKLALKGETLKKDGDSFTPHGGTTEWLNWDVRPWYDEDGEIGGIMMLTEVITEKKNAELELIKAKSQAIKASEAKSSFLANMSHEIRTPLNCIIGLTDILSTVEMDADNARHVQVIQKSGESLLALINDILDLSKIESGEFDLESIDFNFNDMTKQLMHIFSRQSAEKNIFLSQSIEANLPYFRGDMVRINQILVNLVGNAMKFTSEGHIELRISNNRFENRKGNILISVSDTGVGIEPSKHAMIFENFGQAETSTTRTHGGTGLGLAITKNLVHKMNGEIWVESTPGKGSTFFLTMELPPSLVHLPPTKPAKDFMHLNSHSLKILLVDDAIENRNLMLAYLKKFPFEVITAENGIEALELMKTNTFDFVFMDMQMPVMDGLTATFEYRTWERANRSDRLPIVALTAFALQEEKVKCMTAGCDLHLTKPIKKNTVLETIENLIEWKKAV